MCERGVNDLRFLGTFPNLTKTAGHPDKINRKPGHPSDGPAIWVSAVFYCMKVPAIISSM